MKIKGTEIVLIRNIKELILAPMKIGGISGTIIGFLICWAIRWYDWKIIVSGILAGQTMCLTASVYTWDRQGIGILGIFIAITTYILFWLWASLCDYRIWIIGIIIAGIVTIILKIAE